MKVSNDGGANDDAVDAAAKEKRVREREGRGQDAKRSRSFSHVLGENLKGPAGRGEAGPDGAAGRARGGGDAAGKNGAARPDPAWGVGSPGEDGRETKAISESDVERPWLEKKGPEAIAKEKRVRDDDGDGHGESGGQAIGPESRGDVAEFQAEGDDAAGVGDGAASSGGENETGSGTDSDARQAPLESHAAAQILNARLRPPELAVPPAQAAVDRQPWPELVVNGIVRAVRFGHFKKRFDVRIDLRAGVLGALTFHVTSDAGRLRLAFESENDSVLDALRERLQSLEGDLDSAGVRFATVDFRRRSRARLDRGGGQVK